MEMEDPLMEEGQQEEDTQMDVRDPLEEEDILEEDPLEMEGPMEMEDPQMEMEDPLIEEDPLDLPVDEDHLDLKDTPGPSKTHSSPNSSSDSSRYNCFGAHF